MPRYCELTRKHAHDDKEKAFRHRTSMKVRMGEQVSVYFCRFCEGWHVGHNSAQAKTKKRPTQNLDVGLDTPLEGR